ncbi:hypothetical protein SDRG_11432 [Saprolegnia diclina VS20]|uniref:ADP-ribosylation factor n=1 Tax=Saprolegnia diclina (strain VS20) TaxID=1156394 RepID=T0PZI0_SAPDV|nr:hypothetical protein SDRG_11432 [Saprolegnia diclina VS20]EQC30959.1 hypothetical protein SDRG_11432 [Saprolegnia diclina VS20]|eukprot:XP_008615697.1 hypothetical protein SDRG_11432 [Saprolegnia diclina VS20]
MGSITSRLRALVARKRKLRVMLVGLDGAGKTTLLYRAFLDETLSTVPTVSYNLEIIQHKCATLTMWDFGGDERCRRVWVDFLAHQYHIVIFVVDATAVDRLDEAKHALHDILGADAARDCRVLIFANKQDRAGALDDGAISSALDLAHLKQRMWKVQGGSATNGSGVHEGLAWCAQGGC